MSSEPTFREKYAFPSTFWSANVIELFERAAFYAMASFVVIYLGQLGFGATWPGVINGPLLWGTLYLMPIFSGTMADRIGFKKALLLAFGVLAIGYFLMGSPVWFGGHRLQNAMTDRVTVGWQLWITVIMGIQLIGLGGSFVKPCIAGTVQKTAGARKTLGFAIFYMVINIGSVVGRVVAYFVRSRPGFDLSIIFGVSMAAALVAFVMVLFFYKDPDLEMGVTEKAPSRSLRDIFMGIFTALGNGRFALFIVVASGFYFIYNQVYTLLPLYVKRTVELSPRMDLYTAANPVVIVAFQLLITKLFGKLPPIKSIVIGTVIIGLSMLINIVPVYLSGGVEEGTRFLFWVLPLGSVFIILTVALIAFGELFASSRLYEYIGSLSPKGQEGLFLGYAQLPMGIGAIVGGPVGTVFFNYFMCRHAERLPNGLLKLDPTYAMLGWVILGSFGLLSALSMLIYNRWLQRQPA
ncbi:MAG: MFS transporter [Geothrix sp.]|uniref:MFS transporter n=1 Tax=Geothrix sp. TaxID=1962974 RepID=UPI0017F6E002|nr:MFS transporter [Geothrix sp.]NWJ40737.1 MFS transporter [Geothrix sp.]WIL21257.1 MAG: MFS transporter [Geothrix sp.]